MTVSQRVHAQVGAVVLLVAGLAFAGWLLAPAKATAALVVVSTMVVIWLVVAAIGSARPFSEQSAAERGFLTASVAAAGLIMALSFSKSLVTALGFDGGAILDRAVGIAVGLMLVAIGNTIPKVLSPLTAKRCAPAQVQSIKRLAGWTFTIAGLVCIAAWIFLPVAQATDWQQYSTMAAMAIVILRHAWAFLGPAAARSPTREV